MSGQEDDPYAKLGEALDALLFWAAAALNSTRRVIATENSGRWAREHPGERPNALVTAADAALMVLALRNVLRAADWAATVLKPDVPDLAKVLDEFSTLLPGLVNARNALEHFDEYAVGRGRLQKASPVSYQFELVYDGVRPVVTVGPLRIDVSNALNACDWLVTQLLRKLIAAGWSIRYAGGEVAERDELDRLF